MSSLDFDTSEDQAMKGPHDPFTVGKALVIPKSFS